jgi:hypothetical protein
MKLLLLTHDDGIDYTAWRVKKERKKEQYRLSNQQVDTPFTLYSILWFQAGYIIHMLSFDYDIHSFINWGFFSSSFSIRLYISLVHKKKKEEKNKLDWNEQMMKTRREKNWQYIYIYVCVRSQLDDLVTMEWRASHIEVLWTR